LGISFLFFWVPNVNKAVALCGIIAKSTNTPPQFRKLIDRQIAKWRIPVCSIKSMLCLVVRVIIVIAAGIARAVRIRACVARAVRVRACVARAVRVGACVARRVIIVTSVGTLLLALLDETVVLEQTASLLHQLTSGGITLLIRIVVVSVPRRAGVGIG